MTIVANNFKRLLGKKSAWLFVLIIPILLNLLLVGMMTRTPTYNVGILDQDGSGLTKQFRSSFEPDCKIMDVSVGTDIQQAILQGNYDLVVVFASDYEKNLLAGETVQPELYFQGGNNQMQSMQSRIVSYFDGVHQIAQVSNGDAATFEKGMDEYAKGAIKAKFTNFAGADSEVVSTTVRTLGVLALSMVFMMTTSASMIMYDRRYGIYDRVRLTPLSRASYFGQYLLSLFAITAIQLLVVMAVLPRATQVSYGDTPSATAWIIGLALAFGLFAVAKAMLIFRIMKSEIGASAINTVIDLPMLMLAGAMWPRELMPQGMQRIGELMPPAWLVDGAENVLSGGAAPLIQMGLLFGVSVVLLAITFLVRPERERG